MPPQADTRWTEPKKLLARFVVGGKKKVGRTQRFQFASRSHGSDVPFACACDRSRPRAAFRSPCTMGSTSGATRRRPSSPPRMPSVHLSKSPRASRARCPYESFVVRLHVVARTARAALGTARARWCRGATSSSRRVMEHVCACRRPRATTVHPPPATCPRGDVESCHLTPPQKRGKFDRKLALY